MDLISPKPDLLVVFTDAIKCKVGREFLAYMSKKINLLNIILFIRKPDTLCVCVGTFPEVSQTGSNYSNTLYEILTGRKYKI